MARLVSRDPFARTELHSSREYGVNHTTYGIGTCKWCGQTKRTPTGRRYLLKFTWESDGGSKAPITGLFCTVSCMRSFHT